MSLPMSKYKLLLSKVTYNEFNESEYESIDAVHIEAKNNNEIMDQVDQIVVNNKLVPVSHFEVTQENSQYWQAWFDYDNVSYLVEVMGKGYD